MARTGTEHTALNDPGHALRVVAFGHGIIALHEHVASPKGLVDRIVFPILRVVTSGVVMDFAQIWRTHPEFSDKWLP